MGNTRHVNELNNISLNYIVASTHFRFFFLSIPLNHKKTIGKWKFKHKLKWNKFYYFFFNRIYFIINERKIINLTYPHTYTFDT